MEEYSKAVSEMYSQFKKKKKPTRWESMLAITFNAGAKK